MMSTKRVLMAGVCSLLFALPAFAQQKDQPGAAKADAAKPDASQPAVEKVVVTATKRKSTIQKEPFPSTHRPKETSRALAPAIWKTFPVTLQEHPSRTSGRDRARLPFVACQQDRSFVTSPA